jgi:GAF domain-containing protein
MIDQSGFRSAYAAAFLTYLGARDERTRSVAYELGREAVAGGLSVLELAEAHHEALLVALRGGAGAELAAEAAGDFFLDSLSAYEMVQRGVGEAHAAARLEQRRAQIVRQLSSFLTDASLAGDQGDSLHEILHLVAEQARELTGGACCVATLTSEGTVPARAASFSRADGGWGARLALSDLSPLERFVGSTRSLAGADVRSLLGTTESALDGVGSWIASPLTALDGRRLGFLHLFDRRPGAFTKADDAVLLQLAQMASAAAERVRMYADAARSDR